MKIVADMHIPFINEYFGHAGELILKQGRSLNVADVRDAEMLLVRSVTHVNADLLTNSAVKFVGSVTAGADHLDTEYLDAANIQWSIARGFNAPPVADYVFSVIAALQSQHLFLPKNKPLKAAVIGVGNVGRIVAERLHVFNIEVILCDPFRAMQDKDFISTPLDEIADVDLISLHVPLTRTGLHPTYHFVNKTFLSKQKPGCVLINASRGAVVDTQALLSSAKHLQWCFDVWEHEPDIDQAVLRQAFIATPHIAGYSLQSKLRGVAMIHQAACELGFIKQQNLPPILMPEQILVGDNQQVTWQQIVLKVFDPLTVTQQLRAAILEKDNKHAFDEMRHQFNFRHEFAFTSLDAIQSEASKQLQALAFKL